MKKNQKTIKNLEKKLTIFRNLLIFIDEIFGVPWNGTNRVLLAVTTQCLRTIGMFLSTTIAQRLHHRINFCFKHFSKLKKGGK